MAKISVIGAGNVGAACANSLAHMNFVADVVLLDIKEGVAEGKAIDIMQSSKMFQFNTRVVGVTNDYKATQDSDVVIITSGIPRKPGMTREELIGTNAQIVGDVVKNVLKYSPDTTIITLSNPMDTLAYLIQKVSGLSRNKVIGMGGMLDSGRFIYYLSEALNVPMTDIEGMVIGGHSDTTMVPLIHKAMYQGVNVTELLPKEKYEKVVADTMVGGATLTKLLGTSAWIAPGTAAAVLAKSVILDEKRLLPCCVSLEGEYGLHDICIGVPVIVGKNGVERIVEIDLNPEEKELFQKSAEAVKKTNEVLREMSLL